MKTPPRPPSAPGGTALVYSDETRQGYARVRVNGRAFHYLDTRGKRIVDAREIERIDALAIPPAYEQVWICPSPLGHLQATGPTWRRFPLRIQSSDERAFLARGWGAEPSAPFDSVPVPATTRLSRAASSGVEASGLSGLRGTSTRACGGSILAVSSGRWQHPRAASNCKRMWPLLPGTPVAASTGHTQGDAMRDPNFEQCMQACYECAVACDICASACLEDNPAHMKRCIGLCIDCAAVCRLCAAMLARDGEFATAQCTLCALMCDACARECSSHEAQHCQVCAGACLGCTLACRDMLEA